MTSVYAELENITSLFLSGAYTFVDGETFFAYHEDMNRMQRLLLLYCSIVTTVTLVGIILIFRAITQNSASIEERLDKLTKEAEMIKISSEQSTKLSEDLIKLKNELIGLEDNPSDTLGVSTKPQTSTPSGSLNDLVGFIILDKKWQAVEAYEKKTFSSKVLGKIYPDKTYIYLKKEDGWYLVKINDDNEGWINSRFISEVDKP